jgi:hypothetical protein
MFSRDVISECLCISMQESLPLDREISPSWVNMCHDLSAKFNISEFILQNTVTRYASHLVLKINRGFQAKLY